MGPLPPSSSSCALPAARAATLAPVSTEPTKPTPATPGWPTSASPTTGPGPGHEVERPARRAERPRGLASAMTSASTAQHAVVDGAGTQTTVLPAASAGAKTSAPIVYGQFHGLTTPTTPSGTRPTRIRRPAETDGGQRARPALGVLAGHPEVLGQLIDLVEGLGDQRLALVEGQHPGQVLAPPPDPGDDLLAPGRALERGGARPRGPGARRGADRVVDVGRVGDGHRGERLARRRADRLGRPGSAAAPGAVDVQQVLAHERLPFWAGLGYAPAQSRPSSSSDSGSIRNAGPDTDRAATQVPAASSTGAATATSPSSSSATAVA